MKKRFFSIFLAVCVVLSLNIPLMASANDNLSIGSSNQITDLDLLNETFIEYDYETGRKTTFTYASVVDSLKQINPDYTDYTAPFGLFNESANFVSNSDNTRTILPNSPTPTLVNVYEEPYTYTMRIQVIKEDSTSYGTGFMISKYVMLTCAHTIYGDDVEEIRIYPFNNERIDSLDDETYYHPRSWVFSSNYITGVNTNNSTLKSQYDWCYLTLHEPLGEETGYFSFATISNNVSNINVEVTGYPGNNSIIPDFQRYGQYKSSGTLSAQNTYRVSHSCSTYSGQSGSPIYLPGNIVIAVHTTGGTTNNYGVRITTTLYNLLINKINQVG